MGKRVELPSFKPRLARRQGLRKLSPDLISKATEETATQVTRVGLTFLGTAVFCLLSLLGPDTALLGGSDKINVPFAGPVSFLGFMLLGPTVLIALRIYLQIYVEHGARLERLARTVSPVRAPTLVPLENSLIRLFSFAIFYTLLPVAVMLFAWKAAVFPAAGGALFSVAAAVIASHLMLPFSGYSWRSRGTLSLGAAAIIAGAVSLGMRPLNRPFDLYRANLSGQWLINETLRNADLRGANLSGTDLRLADLSGSNLIKANLSGTDLTLANLSKANLTDTDLTKANLTGAELSGADLSGANLSGTDLSGTDLSDNHMTKANLSGADLRAVNLTKANLRGADLGGANLTGAKLNGAKLDGANLRGANLSGADLRAGNLLEANLSGADLSGADLSTVNLPGANLSGADLSSAFLKGADLSGANLTAKNLTQRRLDEACGNASTKLPKGLTLKQCSTD